MDYGVIKNIFFLVGRWIKYNKYILLIGSGNIAGEKTPL